MTEQELAERIFKLPEMREYLLREVQTAVKMMARDHKLMHAFDVDKTGKLAMVLVLVPKEQIDKLPFVPSRPL